MCYIIKPVWPGLIPILEIFTKPHLFSQTWYNPCPLKYAHYYFSWRLSIATVYLCANPTYVTATCFSASHVSSSPLTSHPGSVQYSLSSFTTMSYLTLKLGAVMHQRLRECPTAGSNRSPLCVSQGAMGNLMGVRWKSMYVFLISLLYCVCPLCTS